MFAFIHIGLINGVFGLDVEPCGLAGFGFALGAIFRYGGVYEAVTQSSVFGRGFSEHGVSWLISNADVNKTLKKNRSVV